MTKEVNKILLVGGGSGGPVAPLLAVAEQIKVSHKNVKFLFVGGKNGPEAIMAKNFNIPFVAVSAGKLRRYFSLQNFFTPFLVLAGFFESFKIINEFKPQVAFGAGSFIQVPVLYAAWFKGVKILIHQQDLRPSLANTLCAPIASKITVSFESSVKAFFQGSGLLSNHKKQKCVFTGNPFRQNLKNATKLDAEKFFHLKKDWPTLLVLGGGTGAKYINDFVINNLENLTKTFQVIHLSGKGKDFAKSNENYHPYEFLKEMDLAYAAADIVICRAGLSTITELSALGKVSVVIPMPNSHQEDNAGFLWYCKAAVVLDQNRIVEERLVSLLKNLLFKPDTLKMLSVNIKKIMPHNASEKIAELILDL